MLIELRVNHFPKHFRKNPREFRTGDETLGHPDISHVSSQQGCKNISKPEIKRFYMGQSDYFEFHK